MYSTYGNAEEVVHNNWPETLGKGVITATYVDANLYHGLITSRAATGLLHFLNGTPIDWFSKQKNMVEMAPYGSEFAASKIGVDQIIDLQITLRQIIGKVSESSFMFRDNQLVVTRSALPHSGLNERHNALANRRVCEAVATQVVSYIIMDGKRNPADILSKHGGTPADLAYRSISSLLAGSPQIVGE